MVSRGCGKLVGKKETGDNREGFFFLDNHVLFNIASN